MITETHIHREGHATERMAATRAEAGALPIKQHILALLAENPGGVTPDEYCLEFGGLINTVRRRFTDLWKEGRIRHHPDGLTRRNISDNECVVWVLGEDSGRKPSRFVEMQSEIARLRGLLRAHGIHPDQGDLFAGGSTEWPAELMCRLQLPVPVAEFAAICTALDKLAKKQGKVATVKQVGEAMEFWHKPSNAEVCQPEGAKKL
jgi:hypothetical protein